MRAIDSASWALRASTAAIGLRHLLPAQPGPLTLRLLGDFEGLPALLGVLQLAGQIGVHLAELREPGG